MDDVTSDVSTLEVANKAFDDVGVELIRVVQRWLDRYLPEHHKLIITVPIKTQSASYRLVYEIVYREKQYIVEGDSHMQHRWVLEPYLMNMCTVHLLSKALCKGMYEIRKLEE